MKQVELSSPKQLGIPSHVADPGKIVLGAGVRMPILNMSAHGRSNVVRGTGQNAAAAQKTA